MLKQTDTPETVRLSHSINDEERKYVTARKTLIKEWLNSQDISCELEDVPNIALLGSGGGERAAVGMLGSLHQLAQDDLLGSFLYMCGVSGTTWCMSSLYSDPDWSLNKRCDEVLEKLKGPTVDLKKAVDWLRQRKENDQDFNLTDFWGAFTASYFMKEMNTRCLSEEAHRNSTNPYPIYSAIELDCNRLDYTKEVWFEMTPHESGFSGLGAFVPTSCLGSKFEGGTLKEKRNEMDMVLLQGICGSAIADGQRNIDEVMTIINKKIWGLFGVGKKVLKSVTFSAGIETNGQDSMMLMSGRGREVEEVCECVPSRVVRCMSELMQYAEDPDALMKAKEVITTLGWLLDGLVSSKGEMLWNMDSERWKRTSLVERKEFIETVSLELILSSDSWTKDWEDQRCNCNGNDEGRHGVTMEIRESFVMSSSNQRARNGWSPFPRLASIFWIVKNISPLLIEWEWGTTSNFLFNIKDAKDLTSMASKEKIHLIDAGLKINSPYPPILRTERDVDLIISLDFSAGDPFETVFSAKQYADELELPFPPVKESMREAKDHPQDCYVFEGRRPEEPTVMHMPLFNLQNCRDEEEIKTEREKYTTFQQHYGAPEIDHLLKKAKDNLKNNRDRILGQIIMAVQRRKNRKSVAQRISEGQPVVRSMMAKRSLKRSMYSMDQENSPIAPKRPHQSEQGNLGYYLMPIGSNPNPMGPISMQYWPQQTPGQTGSPWGYYHAQQQNGSPWGYHQAQQPSQVPAQGQNVPPPPMAFPGYFLLPMACAASPLPQHVLPQTPTY
ncbi:cytosolic phospholipase A2 gamma-like isoform X3 [Salvelinus fontinalis]|uniref:cytosolic phospholipase A2 gamma-like isoform X3 n=1 Tax=Salvelinus fontinalis TaxID=8038 RepID=UPI002485AE63|nr:cytosolic phospholipase A2 gamma-like isoform X3 [Salvelinus fontinalis]